MTEQQALLILDDGTCFSGFACGKQTEAMGEVIFTTGMAGYQETLTDPSYHGQIVVFTAAHAGNYGACPHDDEAPLIQAGGAIFHDLFLPGDKGMGADKPAPFPHWRAEETLDFRLRRDGISGMYGVDTRALTLHLRKHGARNGIISALNLDKASLLRRARALPAMRGRDLTGAVSCAAPYEYGHGPENMPAPYEEKLRVAVYDYGVKRSILDRLLMAGMAPTVWPAATPAETILASQPDGVLLSNGPGDPQACTHAVQEVRKLLGVLPLFGICLGHQILALALGGTTYKLPFGHHGVNHPVQDGLTGRVWITSQNHGFCVDPDSLPEHARPSHWNLNDHTLAGLTCDTCKAFSVQFHPEAGPGPHDAAELFLRFRKLMLSEKNKH
ncbi:glutamine-hydrolyzing carbamoyl-phosphate synthase small subunit [Desulfococcaceae bacterium OttesenSCG-928-F15]|nr:glutamine-hydrolyzing carbamoyl-phosphate synthase small subunit [Desulfococcaceae bacterium OttesenSCG-928-F15]